IFWIKSSGRMETLEKNGDPGATRTHDPLIKSQQYLELKYFLRPIKPRFLEPFGLLSLKTYYAILHPFTSIFTILRHNLDTLILIIIVLLLCINSNAYAKQIVNTELISCNMNCATTIHKITVPNLSITKRKIISTADKLFASKREKSFLLAIASIETKDMSIDYPAGDGKKGDAYNVSIYKINLALLKSISPNIDADLIHNDIEQATQIVLTGIRKFGINNFLRYLRAGESGFNGKISENDIIPYINAIKDIACKYLSEPWQFNPATIDNIRYTIHVPAI
ncbi:MAG: hypothetical protein AAF195_04715, partial [Pseudomonadota bacterium]